MAWTELEFIETEETEDETEEHHGQYSCVCKCGYRYTVSEPQLDRLLDADDVDVEEIRLSCEWCSLGVRITVDKR